MYYFICAEYRWPQDKNMALLKNSFIQEIDETKLDLTQSKDFQEIKNIAKERVKQEYQKGCEVTILSFTPLYHLSSPVISQETMKKLENNESFGSL